MLLTFVKQFLNAKPNAAPVERRYFPTGEVGKCKTLCVHLQTALNRKWWNGIVTLHEVPHHLYYRSTQYEFTIICQRYQSLSRLGL